ncbi:probable xyloglucan endotransglucosylase/hydrolase protein 32 [Primulina eburnea]|uniref:probable xyloglucan endotransglucosylase/hydrolase protein 32 n=1 Tax=Primulina eburnea TaxID=1245227 RepID=UPI003C6C716A
MSPLVIFLFSILFYPSQNEAAQGPPSSGYCPTSNIGPTPFEKLYTNRWGPQHQTLDQATLTIWLDKTSGSGFKSLNSYSSGYFGSAIKLHPGYTAGVITSFYLSNNEDLPGDHDEIDIEFLGTTEDKPYVLQTNVYMKGSGDGDNIVGREMRFHLWFDPAKDFHDYGILWNPDEIIFLVDDIPIRRYPRKTDATFPLRPMYVYGSIWDASSWATENGKYKADYTFQPFVGKYNNFKTSGCEANTAISCRPATASPSGSTGLSSQQYAAMAWVQTNYMFYDYCQDLQRNIQLTPECDKNDALY